MYVTCNVHTLVLLIEDFEKHNNLKNDYDK